LKQFRRTNKTGRRWGSY